MIKRVVLRFFCVLMCLCAISSTLFAAKEKTADECFRIYLNALKMNRRKQVEKYTYPSEDFFESKGWKNWKKEYAGELKAQGASNKEILDQVKQRERQEKQGKEQQEMMVYFIWGSLSKLVLKDKEIEGMDASLEYVASPTGTSLAMYRCEKIYLQVKMKKGEKLWKVVSIEGMPLEQYIQNRKEELAGRQSLKEEDKK